MILIGITILKLIYPNFRYSLESSISIVYGQPGFSGGFHLLDGLALILFLGALINMILAFFNLIPIPPLDGSGILMCLLSDEAAEIYDRIRPDVILIILGLVFFRFLNFIFIPIQILIVTLARA